MSSWKLSSSLWKLFGSQGVLYLLLLGGGFFFISVMTLLPPAGSLSFQSPHFLAWMAFFCSAFLNTPPSPFLWILLAEIHDALLGTPAGFTSALLISLSFVGGWMRQYTYFYKLFMDWLLFSCAFILIQGIISVILIFFHMSTKNFLDILWHSCLTIGFYPLLTTLMLSLMKGQFLKRR
jgi:cell shape-determining protein MreD